MCIKPKNEVFARHLLSSCKQETSQNLDQFLQKLKLLVKNCGSNYETAEQDQNDAMHDALISGMQSNFIRQRPESRAFDVGTAYEQVRYLEVACHKS